MPTGAEGTNKLNRNMMVQLNGLESEVAAGTASSAAVTINSRFGVITSESLTTTQNSVATLTLTNSHVAVGDCVLATLSNGTNTQGTPVLTIATVTADTVTFKISNMHASAQALNGTLIISFMVVKKL